MFNFLGIGRARKVIEFIRYKDKILFAWNDAATTEPESGALLLLRGNDCFIFVGYYKDNRYFSRETNENFTSQVTCWGYLDYIAVLTRNSIVYFKDIKFDTREVIFTCKDCNKKIHEKEYAIYHCDKCGLESPRSEITATFITTSGFTFCKNCYEKFEVINNARRDDLLKDFIHET